jgi:hypothetical protein
MDLGRRAVWRWVGAGAAACAVGAASAPAKAQQADDHAAAVAIAAQLEHDTAHGPVVAEALSKTKDALERATRFRAAGDEAHAKAADGLALEWAQTGRDLTRAAEAEATAAELRHKAVDAQAQLERTRALVEEGIARVGRLRAQLLEAEKAAKPDRVAVEVHDGDPPPPKKKGATKKSASQDPKTPSKAGGAP